MVWSSGGRGVKVLWVGGEAVTAFGGPKKVFKKKNVTQFSALIILVIGTLDQEIHLP